MTLADFIEKTITRLRKAGIGSPQLDTRLLVGHILKLSRSDLLSQSERKLKKEEITALNEIIAYREKHQSVARIMGRREFWSLNFGLNEATLEPRPDSETLIEAALKNHRTAKRILDLGTGSGCLLLSLLHELQEATGLGIDAASKAVDQAGKNADFLGLGDRAKFKVGNWLTDISEKFDLIISNPPYISTNDIPSLMPEVCEHDPLLALDGGADGLDPYRLLIPQLRHFLNIDGLVVFEIGRGQTPEVVDLFKENGFSTIQIYKDLSQIERCVTAQI